MPSANLVPFDAARVDPERSGGGTAPAWQTSLRHDLGRLRSSRRRVIAGLDAVRRLTPPAEPGLAPSWQSYVDLQVGTEKSEAVVAAIGADLAQAQALLDGSATARAVTRLPRAGSTFEAVLGCLHRAREGLYLVEDDAWVRAQLPTLRAGVATIVGPDDPRTEGFVRYLDDLGQATGPAPRWAQAVPGSAPSPVPVTTFDQPTRELLRAIQAAVDDSRMAAQIAVRGYRNALVIAVAVLGAVAVTFPGVAALADPGMAVIRADVAGVPVGALAGNLSGVEVWGALGSLVAVIAGLWRLRSSRQPSGLQLAQLALKVPAGALTTLFGVLLMQGGIVVQLTAVQARQIPAYAILFGFAQEALTRFVDGKAAQLLDNAKPLSDRPS